MSLGHYTITDRQPTVRFPRLHLSECGERVRYAINGTKSGGEGVPGPTEGPDYDAPISPALEVWPQGKTAPWGGGLFAGGLFTRHGRPVSGQGLFAGGLFAGGLFGGGGYFDYTVAFALKNGTFCIGVRREDSLGNEELVVNANEVLVTVAALPREAKGLELTAYDGETNVLTISWRRSPDVA